MQVAFHANAIERGLGLEELPDMEVWLTLNGAQKNFTVDEDAEIVPSHEEVSLSANQQNVQISGEKMKELPSGLKSTEDGTEGCSGSSAFVAAPQVPKVDEETNASAPQGPDSLIAFVRQTSSSGESSTKLQSALPRGHSPPVISPLEAGVAPSHIGMTLSINKETADKNISSNVVKKEMALPVHGQCLTYPWPSVEQRVRDALNDGTTQSAGSVHCIQSQHPQSLVGPDSENMPGVPPGHTSQSPEGQTSSAQQCSAAGQTTSSLPPLSTSKRKTPVDVNFLMDEVKAKLLSRYPFLSGQPEVLASLVAQQTAILQYYMAQGVTNPTVGSAVNVAAVRAATPPQAPPGLTSASRVNVTVTSPASCTSTASLPSISSSQPVTEEKRDTVSRNSPSESTNGAHSLKTPPGISALPCSSSGSGNTEKLEVISSQNQQRLRKVSLQPVPHGKPESSESIPTVAQVLPRNNKAHSDTFQSPPPGTAQNFGNSLPRENQAVNSEPLGNSAQPKPAVPLSGSSNSLDEFGIHGSMSAEAAFPGFEGCVTPNPSSSTPGPAQSQSGKVMKDHTSLLPSSVPRQISNTITPEIIKSDPIERKIEGGITTPSSDTAPNQEVPQPMDNSSNPSERVIKFPLRPQPLSAQPWMQQFQSYSCPALGQMAPRSVHPCWPRYCSPAPMNFQSYGSVPFQGMGNWRNPTYPQLPVFQNMPGQPPNSHGSYFSLQTPNPHPSYSGHQMQTSFPPESRFSQGPPLNVDGKGNSPVHQTEWPTLPQPQSQRSDPNPDVKNWRDCLNPELPVFQKTKNDSTDQILLDGRTTGECTGGSQKETWDDVEDFPELKVCGYDPKRDLDYGTVAHRGEKPAAATQVNNIPGLTGVVLDGIRRQSKGNNSVSGNGTVNSQPSTTAAWCFPGKN